jgi:ubiquitin carboxyl-terminal hydrolase 20/33
MSQGQRAHGAVGAYTVPLLHYYISRAWLYRLETFAEPGPITNHDFLCSHGRIVPHHADCIDQLYSRVSAAQWTLLHDRYASVAICARNECSFDGGPVCAQQLVYCPSCTLVWRQMQMKRQHERATFQALTRHAYDGQDAVKYAVSTAWMREWEQFVNGHTPCELRAYTTRRRLCTVLPGEINNSSVLRIVQGETYLRRAADVYPVSPAVWRFLRRSYGGGPKVCRPSS